MTRNASAGDRLTNGNSEFYDVELVRTD